MQTNLFENYFGNGAPYFSRQPLKARCFCEGGLREKGTEAERFRQVNTGVLDKHNCVLFEH